MWTSYLMLNAICISHLSDFSNANNLTIARDPKLLAHYCELPWAESYGVDRLIVRVSVGLEDPEEIWSKFVNALEAASVSKSL